MTDQESQDPLTGVANRTVFVDLLTHAVDRHRRYGRAVAVLTLDLDDFELVTDNLGHPAGDELLALAAQRLRTAAPPSDAVTRLGGDEFAVLLDGESAEDPLRTAEQVVRAFDEPFTVNGQEIVIRPSVGLAAIEEDDDVTAATLVQRASVARDTAKVRRAGQVQTFRPEMSDAFERSDARHGPAVVQLLGELREAVDNQDLTAVYQPKLDLRTDEIVGVEALIRWQHPQRGLLRPDEFLPLVRRRNLMGSITDIVLDKALHDAACWKRAGARVTTAVNLFAPSLGDRDLPNQIVRGLLDHGLRPEDLTLEITEDMLLENMECARAVVERLRGLGIRVAIDDFGCGYSGLWYLRDLPVDELKLDRRYITPLLVDRRSAVIVRAIVDLAHELGVTTVAEGVESAEIADLLRAFGCDIGQGYHFSAPLTGDEMLTLLSTTTTARAAVRSS